MTVTVFVIYLTLIAISYVGGVAVGGHLKKSLVPPVRKQPQPKKGTVPTVVEEDRSYFLVNAL